MSDLPDTPAQAAARKALDEASRNLAMLSVKLKDVRMQYDAAVTRYNIAYGAALQAGIIK